MQRTWVRVGRLQLVWDKIVCNTRVLTIITAAVTIP